MKEKKAGYVNPNYVAPELAKYGEYKPFIDEFLATLPVEQETFSIDDLRAFFAGHKVPVVAVLAAEMTDGQLDDLCARHGLQR